MVTAECVLPVRSPSLSCDDPESGNVTMLEIYIFGGGDFKWFSIFIVRGIPGQFRTLSRLLTSVAH